MVLSIVFRILRAEFDFSDLAVGSFRENMRELADDIMLSSDTSIIVDSRESAMKEAGDIVQTKVR
jgi:ornithine cyclodeaminase/alanine dehydrogenase-like protein (mu-crystallin family)